MKTHARNAVISALATKYSGQEALRCPSGTVDLLTYMYAIIIRPVDDWCGALGQALASAIDTKRKPAVYLFDTDARDTCIEPQRTELLRIDEYLRKTNVVLMNESHVYRPFANVLTTDAIVAIVKITLTISIQLVRSLALDRRIYTIVDQTWPTVARSSLMIVSPMPMDLTSVCYVLQPLSVGQPGEYAVRLRSPVLGLDILNIYMNDKSTHGIQRVYVHYGNRKVYCKRPEDKYVPYDCVGISMVYRARYNGRDSVCVEGEIARWARPYLYAKIKHMMTRVLPELVDSFDFPEEDDGPFFVTIESPRHIHINDCTRLQAQQTIQRHSEDDHYNIQRQGRHRPSRCPHTAICYHSCADR